MGPAGGSEYGAGVLSGLALGRTLDELLAPVLLVCAVSMAVLHFGKEGGA